jgi:CRP-like cAMP-binding protein
MMDGTRSANLPLTDLLAIRFAKLHPLSEHERNVLRLIEGRPKHSHRPDTVLLSEKAEFRVPHFITSGWASCLRELGGGRRQIIKVLLPGDAIGLTTRPRPLSFTTVVALSSMRTAEAPEITVAWQDRVRVPGLAAALDLAAAEDEFFLINHITRLGRQTAYERMANWFLEVDYRLSSRGLSSGGAFQMPMTQEALADALGLSVVHVNRTLQQMRREGRIELTRGRLSLLDREALREAGEFSPPQLAAKPADPPPAVPAPQPSVH